LLLRGHIDIKLTTSKHDTLNLIERDLVAGAIVELRRARASGVLISVEAAHQNEMMSPAVTE